MRQKLLASAAFILGAALAAPAAADITLNGTVTYDKDVQVTETLDKTKTVNITVTVDQNYASAAESNAVNNQRIGGCLGVAGCPVAGAFSPQTHTYGPGTSSSAQAAGRLVFGLAIDYAALTFTSVNFNIGVTQYNQDVGVGVNQGNMISAAIGENADFLEANNAAAQYNLGNTVTVDGRRTNGTAPDTVGIIHAAAIANSVNGNIGVVQANQNAGVFNNQLNSMSLSYSFENSGVALSNSDLGQWNSAGTATETNTSRISSMTGSVNLNTGVVMGNQSSAYMGNQANIVSLSAAGLF
jgi:hypothetical protein